MSSTDLLMGFDRSELDYGLNLAAFSCALRDFSAFLGLKEVFFKHRRPQGTVAIDCLVSSFLRVSPEAGRRHAGRTELHLRQIYSVCFLPCLVWYCFVWLGLVLLGGLLVIGAAIGFRRI